MDDLIYDARGGIWTLAAAILLLGGYLAWPSRKNIPTHLNLGLFVVAYFTPIALLGALDGFPADEMVMATKVLLVGSGSFLFGILLTRPYKPATDSTRARIPAIITRLTPEHVSVRRRTAIATAASAGALAAALALMGFIPAFADDPSEAKFLRGSYRSAYQVVAPLYRGGAALSATLIPLSLVHMWKNRSATWGLLSLASIILLALTLQRGPTGQGILLFIGIMLSRRRKTGRFLLIAVASYYVGALYYAILGWLGVGNFEPAESGASLLATAAASAPDVSDTLTFFHRWISAGQPHTLGRTLFGGLVPGNFAWNPSVWSLTLGDPSVDVSTLSSGGLRLPLPIWGIVSFGWPGVILIPAIGGVLLGLLGAWARRWEAASASPISDTWVAVLFAALYQVMPGYATMSYLHVLVLVTIWWILSTVKPPADALAGPHAPANPHATTRAGSGARTAGGQRARSRSGWPN